MAENRREERNIKEVFNLRNNIAIAELLRKFWQRAFLKFF